MKKSVLIVLILLVFNSCGFFQNEPDDYQLVNSQIKMLGDFKEGSFWIYHNDSLNINDTINVIKYARDTDSEPWDKHTRYYEYIHITLKNSYNDTIYDFLSGNSYDRKVLSPNKKGKLIFSLRHISNNYYFSETKLNPDLWDQIDLVKNYSINAVKYDSLLCYTPAYSGNQYYFAFDVGIVKKLIRDSLKTNTWYLTKYQITK